MPALLVICPITGKSVSTGIEVEPDVLKSLPRIQSPLHCPACGEKHFWTLDDARLGDEPARSSPAALR